MSKNSETVIVEVEVSLSDIARAERFVSFIENGSPYFRVADREAAFALLKHLIAQSKITHE